MHRPSLILLFIVIFFFSCSKETKEGWNKHVYSSDALKAQKSITTDLLTKHISTLASDEFEGRKPGTTGENKTIKYLIDTFKKFNINPGNPDGTWIQKVTMTGVTSKLKAQFNTSEERWVLNVGDEIIGNSYITKNYVDVINAKVIFCGYGINAPEYEWNDFKNTNINGKIVIVLVNDPPIMKNRKLDNNMFDGDAMTYYGRWSYKYEEALRRGAAGVIVVHESKEAGYPFSVLQSGHDAEHLTIKNPKQKPLKFQGWMSTEAAEKLFRMNSLNFNKLKIMAIDKDFKPIELRSSFSSRITNRYKKITSNNFVAKYEGSDPQLKDEYVVYTAHWDHLGKDTNLKGDQIYNGANDNASGTGIVMAAAEAFSNLAEGSKRSIIFLAVTAEEEGLLGAKYYALNPLYPLSKTLAVINIDAMGNSFGRTKDLVVIGKGNSQLDEILEYASKQDGKYLSPDTEPEKGFYYRSDHFEFAKKGVPSLYVNGGIDVRRKGKKFGLKMKKEYTANHYHSLSDEVKSDWNFNGIAEDAKILFRVGYAIAQNEVWPEWTKGAEFKALRDSMLIRNN